MDQPAERPEASTDEVEEEQPKPKFSDWFAAHRGGVSDLDFQEAFSQLLETVNLTGRSGTIALTFKVSKAGEAFSVVDQIDSKPPKDVQPRLYYMALDGTLQRDNPMAPELLRPRDE